MKKRATYLFFNGMQSFDLHIANESLHATCVMKTGLRTGLIVQKVIKAWIILMCKFLIVSFSNAVMPYM